MSILLLRGSDPVDPMTAYWSSVVLAMPMDGASNGDVWTELKGHTATRSGNAATDTSTKKFGTASARFDGNGDNIGFADSADFTISGDFTVDFWVRFPQINNASELCCFQLQGVDWRIQLTSSFSGADANKITFWDGAVDRILSASVVINTWYHVLLQRKSGVVELFLSGTRVGTYSIASTINPTGINIGSVNNASRWLYGYIDDLRFTNGVARITGTSFTLPTQSVFTGYS